MTGEQWQKILDGLHEPVCGACGGRGFDLDHATYVYDEDGELTSATFPLCQNACWRWWK